MIYDNHLLHSETVCQFVRALARPDGGVNGIVQDHAVNPGGDSSLCKAPPLPACDKLMFLWSGKSVGLTVRSTTAAIKAEGHHQALDRTITRASTALSSKEKFRCASPFRSIASLMFAHPKLNSNVSRGVL
jgi:hypothetical protein